MSELISIADDGAGQSRVALEGCIEAGGGAVFPADTLYGLACDPLNAAAGGGCQSRTPLPAGVWL